MPNCGTDAELVDWDWTRHQRRREGKGREGKGWGDGQTDLGFRPDGPDPRLCGVLLPFILVFTLHFGESGEGLARGWHELPRVLGFSAYESARAPQDNIRLE